MAFILVVSFAAFFCGVVLSTKVKTVLGLAVSKFIGGP